MHQKLFFLITLFTGVIFSSCKTIQPEAPKESYLPTEITVAYSELPIHMELDVKKLEKAVNTSMNGLLYEGSNITDKDLSVKIWKTADFTFSINNNAIEYRVPLKVWSQFAWKVEKLGLSLADDYEATGTIALKYKTVISIDRNWNLVAQTTSQGYEWIETPKLNIIGVNVPVKPIANLAMAKYEKMITQQIDKSLAEFADLKKQVTDAWAELQKPVQTSVENDIWVRIIPKDILVSPFATKAGKLNMDIALYGKVETIMGAKPAAGKPVALPEFKWINRPPQQFNLNVSTDVTFDKISQLAKEQLLNKTFTEGKKHIQITDLSVFGSEGKAVFSADVIGSIKGRIYFTGEMQYNPAKMTVEIINPGFELKTRNALLKSADWLLHGLILKKIVPYLSYPVKEYTDDMKAEANTMLQNYQVREGINLQGKLNELTVKSVNLVPGAIRIQANLKGNVMIKLENMKF